MNTLNKSRLKELLASHTIIPRQPVTQCQCKLLVHDMNPPRTFEGWLNHFVDEMETFVDDCAKEAVVDAGGLVKAEPVK